MKISYVVEDEKLTPTHGSNLAAGWDLRYNGEDITIPPLTRAVLPTGLKIAMDKYTFGKVEARSGLSLNHGTIVLAGVIDSDYRGEIKVIMFNSDHEKPISFKKYERIAQIVFHRIDPSSLELVNVSELPESVRGELGFGSTGQN